MIPWIDRVNGCNKYDLHKLISETVMQEAISLRANSPVVIRSSDINLCHNHIYFL
jgi:hypothetical protein